MTESDILSRLGTTRLGRHLHLLASVDSTNTFAKTLAIGGAPDGTVVVAEEQTAGRGRIGRRWTAEPGASLTFSLIVRPPIAPADLGILPLAAGVAVCETLRAAGAAGASTKWPNDVLVGDRKICGVLSEAVLSGGGVAAAIVGVGLNVNQRSFPGDLAGRATSLAELTGTTHDRAALLAALLGRFEALDALLRAGQSGAVLERWLGASAMIGSTVRVSGAGAVREGTARGLAPDGALLLETDAGLVAVHAGDVTLRIP